MHTIRILHHHEPGYDWSFESPDIPGLTGGSDAYDAANAEDAARFALACAAEEQPARARRSGLRALRPGRRCRPGVAEQQQSFVAVLQGLSCRASVPSQARPTVRTVV